MQTDIDTDVESTQSRQKKGHFSPSDSDKEAIVEFVKQHDEIYDKANDSFKGQAGQAAEKSTECQTWLKDNFSFL